MKPKNEFESDLAFYMVMAQIELSNSVKEIIAEQEFSKTYRGWEVQD